MRRKSHASQTARWAGQEGHHAVCTRASVMYSFRVAKGGLAVPSVTSPQHVLVYLLSGPCQQEHK